MLPKHLSQDTPRNMVESLLQVNKTYADLLGKLPRTPLSNLERVKSCIFKTILHFQNMIMNTKFTKEMNVSASSKTVPDRQITLLEAGKKRRAYEIKYWLAAHN